MTEKRKILLAVDGSDASMETVRYVGAFFSPSHTEIVLLHVDAAVPECFLDLEKGTAFAADRLSMDAWTAQTRRRIQAFMVKGRDILIRAGFPKENITPKIQTRTIGIARDILVEARQGYDAVVVGRSGVSDLKEVVVGSVAHKLVSRMHPVPIAVVGGSPDHRKILIGFDGSEGSMKAVDFVCSVMAQRDRVVMLCHLVRSLGVHLEPELVFNAEQEKRWLKAVGDEIEPSFPEAEERLIHAGFHPSHVYIRILERSASRAADIKKAAEKGGFGTIVLGRRGRSVVEEFTMGRVTRKLLHMADRMAVWIV